MQRVTNRMRASGVVTNRTAGMQGVTTDRSDSRFVTDCRSPAAPASNEGDDERALRAALLAGVTALARTRPSSWLSLLSSAPSAALGRGRGALDGRGAR
jgi:hypothetical protein